MFTYKECRMKRLSFLLGVFIFSLSATGCGSDPREGLTSVAVAAINSSATMVSNIKGKIEDAVKKTETGKTPDFKDAIAEIDALKKKAKEMQEFKMKAD